MEGDDPRRPERHRELRAVGRDDQLEPRAAEPVGPAELDLGRPDHRRRRRQLGQESARRGAAGRAHEDRLHRRRRRQRDADADPWLLAIQLPRWPDRSADDRHQQLDRAAVVVDRDQARRRAGVRVRTEERRPEGRLRRHLAGNRDARAADPQPVRDHDRDRAEERRSRLPGRRRHRAQHLDRRRRLPAIDLAVGRRQRDPVDGHRSGSPPAPRSPVTRRSRSTAR